MEKLRTVVPLHPLTVEDILVREEREKIELFKSYYLVSFREATARSGSAGATAGPSFLPSLDQSNTYLVVLKDGLISFHQDSLQDTFESVISRIQKPALEKVKVSVSSDWIAYAIMDTVVDRFFPLMGKLEDEVQRLEDLILSTDESPVREPRWKWWQWHRWSGREDGDGKLRPRAKDRGRVKEFGKDITGEKSSKRKHAAADTADPSPGGQKATLMRLHQSRQMALILTRLLGTKADVLRGLVKRSHEAREVDRLGEPAQELTTRRQDVGLYLSDIGDHVAMMLEALVHYDTILSSLSPMYTSTLRTGLMATKVKTDMTMMRFGMIGAVVLPIQFVTNIMSSNVHIPWFKVTNPSLHAWDVLVALVVTIATSLTLIFYYTTRSISRRSGKR